MPPDQPPGTLPPQMLVLASTPPRTPLRIVDDTDDASLIEAVASGNASRAVVLYDRLRPVVSRTVRRLAPRSLEHEDLVQQAFVELVVSLRARPRVRSLDAWASTIAARTVYQRLRRVKLEERFGAVATGEDLEESPAATNDEGPLVASVRRRRWYTVRAAMVEAHASRLRTWGRARSETTNSTKACCTRSSCSRERGARRRTVRLTTGRSRS